MAFVTVGENQDILRGYRLLNQPINPRLFVRWFFAQGAKNGRNVTLSKAAQKRAIDFKRPVRDARRVKRRLCMPGGRCGFLKVGSWGDGDRRE